MTSPDRIEELARSFVDQLVQVARDLVIESLHNVNMSGGASNGTRKITNGSAPKASKPSKRSKGAKRDSSEIEALAEKFLKYVKANPAVRIETANAALGTSTKDLQLPVRKLIKEKKLKAVGTRRATKYTAR